MTGAAVAVAVSFLAAVLLWREPRLDGDQGRPLPAGVARVLGSSWFRRVLAGLGLLAAAWTGVALLFGADSARNPVPWVVYVLLWVGLVPLSVLFGPVWRLLNPLRTVHALLNRALGLDPADGVRPLPPRLGYWPGAAGLLAFTWLELVAPDNADLTTLRFAIGLYVTVQLLAALVFGSGWFERGDAFEVWSGLFGRMSVLGRREDGVLVLRRPTVGLAALPGPGGAAGLVATVAVMLGSTAYDGIAGSSSWTAWAQEQPVSQTLLGTLGLLGSVAAVGALYVVCAGAAGVAAGTGWRGMPTAFAHSLVPVALGYVVAHYWSLFVLEGQRAVARLSDPLANGSDLLGTGSWTPSTALVEPTLVACVMVAAVVGGHVVGVLLAHDRAVRLFPRRAAAVGQVPLMVLMVTLTCLGLFLLFSD